MAVTETDRTMTDRTVARENQAWERTNDEVGLRPAIDIICPICANREKPIKSKMTIRRSRVHTVPDVRMQKNEKGETVRPYAFDIACKCPICDFYCIFGVPSEADYVQEVLQKRQGKMDFVLPEDEWNKDELIKEKLKQLGYW